LYCTHLAPIAGLALTWIIAGAALPVDASESNPADTELTNCVDRCIATFTELSGRSTTPADIHAAIRRIGANPNAIHRSLAECREILNELGVSVTAIRIRIDSSTQFPPVSIVYIRHPNQSRPGHVVVVKSGNGVDLQVYDPTLSDMPSRVRADELIVAEETIALVLTRSHMWNVSQSSIAIGMTASAILLLLAILRARRNSRIPTLAAIMLFPLACQRGSDSALAIDPIRHDFGVIRGEDCNRPVQHDIRIANNTSREVTIVSGQQSCQCVQLAATPLSIPAGESRSLPVSVRLGQKSGPFLERVSLAISPEEIHSPVIVELRGFVDRGPVPTSRLVEFQSQGGRVITREIEIVYPRVDNRRGGRLTSWTVSGEGQAYFKLNSPRREIGATRLASIADVWRLSIDYHPPPDGRPQVAQLQMQFEADQATSHQVEVALYGKQGAPLVMLLTGDILIPDLALGQSHSESVPVRILSSDGLESVDFEVGSEMVRPKLDEQNRSIKVAVHATRLGPFRVPVTVRYQQDILGELSIIGTVRPPAPVQEP